MSDISRREFLKIAGAGALAASATACGVKTKSHESHNVKAGTGEMTMRTNHNTGDTVSILGYGMMRLPTTKVVNGVNEEEVIDQEQVNALVDYAMEHGVNYYDTAPVYCQGQSEAATGIALSRYPRDKYLIATKLSNFSADSWPREKSIEMFENSLKNLQTNYIDYLLLHAIGDMNGFNNRYINNGILEYLKEQRANGRIRNLGFSFHGQAEFYDEMLRMMDDGEIHWDFVQIQLNYIDWYREKNPHQRNIDAEYLYNELAKRNIPVVVMEPLLGGALGKLSNPITAKMKQRRPDESVASWAFKFAGQHPHILTVLSGMTYMEHLQDNVRTYSPLEPLDSEELEFINRITREYLENGLVPCTECKYCMPCPYGVDIPTTFAHYNKCINDDNVPRDTRDPRYAEARRAFLVGYDRKVPKLRQADMCIGCGNCATHCPQHIKIPQQLKKIADYADRLRSGQV